MDKKKPTNKRKESRNDMKEIKKHRIRTGLMCMLALLFAFIFFFSRITVYAKQAQIEPNSCRAISQR